MRTIIKSMLPIADARFISSLADANQPESVVFHNGRPYEVIASVTPGDMYRAPVRTVTVRRPVVATNP